MIPLKSSLNDLKIEKIGSDRYYETMAFHAHLCLDKYWDADVSKEIYFDSPWTVSEKGADDKANEMHEDVVSEITKKLLKGEYDETT